MSNAMYNENPTEQQKNYKVIPLTDAFLNTIVTELDNDDIVGIVLGGSYARGEATPYSDVDFACFVPDSSKLQPKRYMYRDSFLLSISTKCIEGVRSDLTKPERAIWLAPGFNQKRMILLDKDGSVGRLMQEIETFTWAPLQEAANTYASFHLMLFTEDVHKVLSGLLQDSTFAIAYAITELLYALTELVAVQRGVLLKSGSTYYQQVQESVGLDSLWTRYHRIVAGVDTPSAASSPVIIRGIACLRLYQETARLLQPILQPGHLEVVEQAVQVIDKASLIR